MLCRGLLLVLACVPLGACGDDPLELFVDLKTDYAGGGEVTRVRTFVSTPDGATTAESEARVGYDDDLFGGLRVGEFDGLRRGAYLVRVTLLNDRGGILSSRTVRAEVRTTMGVTVLITRSCEDVTCPGDGESADRTECLGGSCVPPTCGPSAPETCATPECASDLDCAEGAACAQPRCLDGVCLQAPRTDRCEEGQWCDPTAGCVERVMPGDGGMGTDTGTGMDASMVPDAASRDAGLDAGGCMRDSECDDGNSCTTDSCGVAGCAHVPNSAPCDDGVFCNGADTCSGGACAVHAGNPCSGMSTCQETSNTCAGCRDDSDCPAPVVSAWSSCGGYDDTCDETGTRSRTLTSYTCSGGTCMPSTRNEREPCSRDTEGVVCGDSVTGAWGACGGFSSACDETGSQSRVHTSYSCASGSCKRFDDPETQSCTRSTDGDSCPGSCLPGTCSGGACVGGDCRAGRVCICPGFCAPPGTRCP